MKKRGKRLLSILQISLLISSIIAFNFIFNFSFISATTWENPYTHDAWETNDEQTWFLTKDSSITVTNEKVRKVIESFKKNGKILEATKSVGGATPLPTEATHGYAGEAYEWMFGKGSILPRGKYTGENLEIIESTGLGYSISGIIQGAAWALSIYYGSKMIMSLFGADEKKSNALAKAAASGFFVGKGVWSVIEPGKGWLGFEGKKLGLTAKGWAIGSGLLVAAIIFYNSYKKTETQTVTFTCKPWDAPTGGEYCNKCNHGILPCSEYQCRSLGQACQLVNPGTDEAKCVWVDRHDVTFPTIRPWVNALSDGYKYAPDNTISPPDKGVKIIKKDSTSGCVKAFEPLSFGITLDEPAKCKIDYLRKNSFNNMSYYFGGSSLLTYNHTQAMSLPGPNSEENITLKNNGNYELYVRCQDANGNANTANFVFKFCVEKGPDTTPPLIVTTNLLDNMPIAYNQSSVNLELYTNEPADCKWSRTDQSYKDMGGNMSCSSSALEMNAQMLYKCTTNLTGLKNSQKNNFYFRCEDQPTKPKSERNIDTESYKLTLIGTQPLIINKIGPNETVKDSTSSVKVVLTADTSAGYNEGKAICYYSDTGKEGSYIMFFNTNSNTHSQKLYLPEGKYKYYIKCIDAGGNSDIKTTEFKVETDTSPPAIVRIFHEESYLRLITNEKAECVYDTVNCNYLFDDGIAMKTIDGTKQFTDWSTDTSFYIKCKDEYGNQPAPNECSIVVKPMEGFSSG